LLDVDRQLLLLREIEARIAFVEIYIAKQQALLQRLSAKNLPVVQARDLLRVMHDSLSTLELHRSDLLCDMVLTPYPDEIGGPSRDTGGDVGP
jgi:hypothetical protein